MHNFMKTHYQDFEEKKIREILSAYAGKRVLDYGCGQGKYLKIMKELGVDAVGIDVNPEQIADLRFLGFEVYADSAELKKQRFDCILLSHVIEHFSGDELVELFDSILPYLKKTEKSSLSRLFSGSGFIMISPMFALIIRKACECFLAVSQRLCRQNPDIPPNWKMFSFSGTVLN